MKIPKPDEDDYYSSLVDDLDSEYYQIPYPNPDEPLETIYVDRSHEDPPIDYSHWVDRCRDECHAQDALRGMPLAARGHELLADPEAEWTAKQRIVKRLIATLMHIADNVVIDGHKFEGCHWSCLQSWRWFTEVWTWEEYQRERNWRKEQARKRPKTEARDQQLREAQARARARKYLDKNVPKYLDNPTPKLRAKLEKHLKTLGMKLEDLNAGT